MKNINYQEKTLLFLYKNMDIGGIERYLISLIKKLKEQGNRIIWLSPNERYIDAGFKNDLLDGYVEIIDINTKGLNFINHQDIIFNENEEVIALSFNLVDFLRLEVIKRENESIKINSFFWVPHFKGKNMFFEENVINPLQPILRKFIGEIIKDMESNDNIYYLNKSHLEAFKSNYGFQVENEKYKISAGITRDIRPFNEDLAIFRSRRDIFNIISVGRFEFPHKAYILGLIKVYGEMKIKYKNLKLTIIGYGKDEEKVISEISKLSIEAQKDVNLVGKVPYNELHKYFEEAHLNISVAGAIADGALTGLISIPVRHYCEICEGYGYLPESRDKTTSCDSGIPIKKFIEEVIFMSQQTYVDSSKKSYLSYASTSKGNTILSILNLKNKDWKKTISNNKINVFKMCFILTKILPKIKYEIKKYIKVLREN